MQTRDGIRNRIEQLRSDNRVLHSWRKSAAALKAD
jgi:hypothetical protein